MWHFQVQITREYFVIYKLMSGTKRGESLTSLNTLKKYNK